MSLEYLIKCPIKGTNHSILSKKGQRIIKNYKYIKHNNLSGGGSTLEKVLDKDFLTIRKEFIQLNTTNSILHFLDSMEENNLLNIYIIVSSSS